MKAAVYQPGAVQKREQLPTQCPFQEYNVKKRICTKTNSQMRVHHNSIPGSYGAAKFALPFWKGIQQLLKCIGKHGKCIPEY
jgi:hypothetical protein